MLTGCQNPRGCGKIAVMTVEVIDPETGTVEQETETCAYCADSVAITDDLDDDEEYELRILNSRGENVTHKYDDDTDPRIEA